MDTPLISLRKFQKSRIEPLEMYQSRLNYVRFLGWKKLGNPKHVSEFQSLYLSRKYRELLSKLERASDLKLICSLL